MQITLEVKDNYVDEFLTFLKFLDEKKIKIKDDIKLKEIEEKVKEEDLEISKLSNKSFKEIWDNEEDSVYDKFIK